MFDKRKKVILDKVIESYISTAEPVGSKVIQETCNLELSSATIRNELNELEKDGYLTQLHTSSGRIPTDKGYRLFVDSVIQNKILPLEQRKNFENKIKLIETNINSILYQITEIMTEVIDYTTIVITPDIYMETLKIIHFILVDIDRVLVVLLNSLGVNREFLIEFAGNNLAQDDLNKISQFLTKN
jgi:heat-inducible transcriptional repressor